jgi:tetratricopeptide (TPR) repeat protein
MMKSKIYFILFCLTAFFCLGMSPPVIDQIETAILQKDFKTAEKMSGVLLEQSTLESGDRHKVVYYLGISQLNLDKYRSARETFQGLIRENPESAWRDKAFLGVYNAHFLNGEYKEALASLERLLDASPQSEFLSLIHLKIARAHLKLARWGEAGKHLRIVVENFPDSFEAHTARQFLEEKHYFTVQVGAFQDKDRAALLANELRLAGEYAYIVETVDPRGRGFYRVRVGQLGKLREAEHLRAKLSRQGYPALIYP